MCAYTRPRQLRELAQRAHQSTNCLTFSHRVFVFPRRVHPTKGRKQYQPAFSVQCFFQTFLPGRFLTAKTRFRTALTTPFCKIKNLSVTLQKPTARETTTIVGTIEGREQSIPSTCPYALSVGWDVNCKGASIWLSRFVQTLAFSRGNKKPAFLSGGGLWFEANIVYERAAGFFDAVSRICCAICEGTCSKVCGSIE